MYSPPGCRWFLRFARTSDDFFLGFTHIVKDILFMDYYATVINNIIAFPLRRSYYVVQCRGVVQMTLENMISCLCQLNVTSQPHPFFDYACRPHFIIAIHQDSVWIEPAYRSSATHPFPHLNRGSPCHIFKFPVVWLLVICVFTERTGLIYILV